MAPNDSLQHVPAWRRGAVRRLRWMTRYDGNGWTWLAAGLLLTPIPGLVVLLPPGFDGFLFWLLWPLSVCWLALQVGRVGRSFVGGLVALLASVALVLTGPALVQLGGLRLAGRTEAAVVVEHSHDGGFFRSVFSLRGSPGVVLVPWATETYRLRTLDGHPIRPDLVTAEPLPVVHDSPADPFAGCPPDPGPLDPCLYPEEPGPVGGQVTVQVDPLGLMTPVPPTTWTPSCPTSRASGSGQPGRSRWPWRGRRSAGRWLAGAACQGRSGTC